MKQHRFGANCYVCTSLLKQEGLSKICPGICSGRSIKREGKIRHDPHHHRPNDNAIRLCRIFTVEYGTCKVDITSAFSHSWKEPTYTLDLSSSALLNVRPPQWPIRDTGLSENSVTFERLASNCCANNIRRHKEKESQIGKEFGK